MTDVEKRQIKKEIHKSLVDLIESNSSSEKESYELWCYAMEVSFLALKKFEIKG